jgi:predicted DNA-binding protein
MPSLSFQTIPKTEQPAKITIRIPKSLKGKIEEAAYQSRKSVTLFIREAVEKAIEEVERGATL